MKILNKLKRKKRMHQIKGKEKYVNDKDLFPIIINIDGE